MGKCEFVIDLYVYFCGLLGGICCQKFGYVGFCCSCCVVVEEGCCFGDYQFGCLCFCICFCNWKLDVLIGVDWLVENDMFIGVIGCFFNKKFGVFDVFVGN